MKTKIGDYEVATDLTRLEKIVLKNLWISAEGNGHDFGFTEDHGLADKKQAPGVVSSLVKKGYIRVHETENGYTQFTWRDNNGGGSAGVATFVADALSLGGTK